MDRLLGELHIPQDSVAGREQLETYLEPRRSQENDAEFKAVRRGWCLGDETFRQELLNQAHELAGENHFAETRRETAEEKARRIIEEEMRRLGWQMVDLVGRNNH